MTEETKRESENPGWRPPGRVGDEAANGPMSSPKSATGG